MAAALGAAVTSGPYQVLRDKDILKRNGLLERCIAGTLLQEQNYKARVYPEYVGTLEVRGCDPKPGRCLWKFSLI